MPATGPPPLTPKQQHILAALRDQPGGELTSSALAARFGVKLDVMRRLLERLRERSLIVGTGRGAARSWKLTNDGAAEIADRAPAPIPDPADRVYVVLWERSLADLLEASLPEHDDVKVFVKLDEFKARNTEDAYRRAVRKHGDSLPSEPVLSAVAVRYWQPVPVTVTQQTHISIG